jgi:hypothetical protein
MMVRAFTFAAFAAIAAIAAIASFATVIISRKFVIGVNNKVFVIELTEMGIPTKLAMITVFQMASTNAL